ncbi:MAG: hypothetical protein WC565_07345 [Parcubacteria group bacterium]
MRKAETREFWESELRFIQIECEKGESRMKRFTAYVIMQARFAEDDGFYWIARDMRQCCPASRAPDETAHYRAVK